MFHSLDYAVPETALDNKVSSNDINLFYQLYVL
ncbi:hypothetical protein M3J09_007079 [Ascochyta lentis]